MRSGALLLAAALILACDSPGAPGASASPTASAAAAAPGASGAPTSEPSPLPTSRPGVRASAVGPIPALFRYVALDAPLADGVHTRLWLIDLSSRRAPVLAAEWDAPASPVGGYSASGDGRVVVISAAATRARVALYLLRPETAELRVVYEDPSTVVLSPRISADGAVFAFTKYPANGGSDLGLWSGRAAGGEPKRITSAADGTSVPQLALAWSPDAAWLAFTRERERSEVHLVRADGTEELRAGIGDRASWRTRAPELLVVEDAPAGSRIYAVALADGTATNVTKLEKLFAPSIAWDPRGERFAYVVSESASREASGGIWLGSLGTAPVRIDQGRAIFAPEWSRDGTVLSALAGGDDLRIPIVDVLTGKQLSVLCRRGGTPPADCR